MKKNGFALYVNQSIATNWFIVKDAINLMKIKLMNILLITNKN